MMIYIIIALSFAIMYSYKYGTKIVGTTKATVEFMEIEWGSFNPFLYHIKEFLYNFFMFPVAILRIFQENLVKDEVSIILEKNYGLTSEK